RSGNSPPASAWGQSPTVADPKMVGVVPVQWSRIWSLPSPFAEATRPALTAYQFAEAQWTGGRATLSGMDAIETRGRVRVEAAPKRVRIVLGGVVVADTTDALYVWEGPYYPQYCIPLADVR